MCLCLTAQDHEEEVGYLMAGESVCDVMCHVEYEIVLLNPGVGFGGGTFYDCEVRRSVVGEFSRAVEELIDNFVSGDVVSNFKMIENCIQCTRRRCIPTHEGSI